MFLPLCFTYSLYERILTVQYAMMVCGVLHVNRNIKDKN